MSRIRIFFLVLGLFTSGAVASSALPDTTIAQYQDSSSGWQGRNHRFVLNLSKDDALMPITSIEWGTPDRWSLTSRYVHMFTQDRNDAALIHSLTATLSPGTDGGRVGIGYHGVWKAGPVPLLSEARFVFLRTWRHPLATKPNRSFLGVEIRFSVVGVVNTGIGHYWQIATVDGRRESIWGFHVGVGL